MNGWEFRLGSLSWAWLQFFGGVRRTGGSREQPGPFGENATTPAMVPAPLGPPSPGYPEMQQTAARHILGEPDGSPDSSRLSLSGLQFPKFATKNGMRFRVRNRENLQG